MKKLLFLLLFTIATYGQVSTGQEQEFDYGIKNNAAPTVISPNYITTQGSTGVYGKIEPINLPISNPVKDSLQKKLNLPTGFLQGLQLSINADPTKYNIASGYYTVTDFTDLANPFVKIINYAGATGLTPAYLNTANSTYVALDINGAVVSSASPFTNAQRRTLAIIGNVVHSNLTTINVTNEIKAPIVAGTNQLHDFMRAVGFLNEEGNIYTANGANLQINKSAGRIFGMGVNSVDYLNPHELSLPAQTALTFAYRLRTGTQYANTTSIDPNNWDNNGVLTAVSAGNKWTIQHFNIFQSGLTRAQPGQTVYNSYAEALAALPTDPFVTEQNIADNAVFRAYLIIKQGTTDLQAAITAGTALFVPVDKFGNVVGNGAIALTYSNIVAALGYTPENVVNKQNSLAIDGTGVKYPTVDAINAALPTTYAKVVYVNNVNPNSATIFDLNNPPITNDNALKTDVNNLYIGTDASTWVYNGSIYVTKAVTSDTSNFYILGTSIPAGNSKTASIYRNGGISVYSATNQPSITGNSTIGIGGQFSSVSGTAVIASVDASSIADIYQGVKGVSVNYKVNHLGDITGNSFIKSGGLITQSLLANGGVLANPISGTGTLNYIPKWTGTGTQGSSLFFDNSTDVGIGTSTPYNLGATFRFVTVNNVDGSGFVTQVNGITSGRFVSTATGTLFSEDRNMSFRFFTNGSEKARIHASGGVSIGNTTDLGVGTLNVSGNITAPAATTANHVVIKSQLDAAARPYKVYTALLTQTGTNAPVATVLENTLGATVTWARTATGQYTGTLSSGVFTTNKTYGTINNGQGGGNGFFTLGASSNTVETIFTYNTANTQVDSLLSGASIEIRVYN